MILLPRLWACVTGFLVDPISEEEETSNHNFAPKEKDDDVLKQLLKGTQQLDAATTR